MLITKGRVPVTEAYFGKPKEFIEVEQLLAKMLKKMELNKNQNLADRIINAATKYNTCPENKRIQEIFCKKFGFKEFVLHWDGSDTINANTMIRGIIKLATGGMNLTPVRDNSGRYYDTKHSYLCFVNVYAGLTTLNITAEELMGAILHEIGHNFQCTPLTNFGALVPFLSIPVFLRWIRRVFKPGFDIYDIFLALTGFENLISIFYREKGSEYFRDEYKEQDEYIKNNQNTVRNEVKEYERQLKENAKNLNDKDVVFILPLVMAMLNMHLFYRFGLQSFIDYTLRFQAAGYSGEVFADSFATTYGYGAGLSSFLAKLEKFVLGSQGLRKDDTYNIFNQFVYCTIMLQQATLDPHPLNQTRIKNQVNKLKSELENAELSPAMKKALMDDLVRTEAVYNEMITENKDNKHLAILLFVYSVNEHIFKGKLEIRDIFNRIFNFGRSEA